MSNFQWDVYKESRSRAVAGTAFINQVYIWMTVGLAFTGVIALFVASSDEALAFIFGSKAILIGLVVAQLGVVVVLSVAVAKLSPTVATLCFLAYSALTGITLSSIFVVYTAESVSTAFFVTAATFLAMSAYGTITKRDLSGLGSFLMMGLIGLIIASIVNVFLSSSTMNFVISCAGVLIFTGLTAYDTQKLRTLGNELDSNDVASMRKMSILGALTLYLDFINIFIMLVRLMGVRRD